MRPIVAGADDTFAPWKFSNPWFGTLRARGGFAMNTWLFYGTVGLAYGSLTMKNTLTTVSESHTSAGWTIGAGAEVGFAPNWSAKLEYLHVDLDTQTYSVNAGCVAAPGTCQLGTRLDTIRLGVNWRFMGGL